MSAASVVTDSLTQKLTKPRVVKPKVVTDVTLKIDIREHALMAELEKFGIPYEKETLDVGDFRILIGGEEVPGESEHPPMEQKIILIGERKTLADFAASNTDGRYREQRARLLAAKSSVGCALVYVLEGLWSGNDERLVTGRGHVTEGLLRRLTTRLQIRYGMPVIAAASVAETAHWLRVLVEQIRDDPTVFLPEEGETSAAVMAGITGVLSTVKKENRTSGSVASAMLSAVPGLGSKRCSALLGVKSLRELGGMTKEEIAELTVGGRRLGVKVAEAIVSALDAHC